MTLNRNATAALKGLGIVMIVLHNVVHLNFHVGENEFAFSRETVEAFMTSFGHSPLLSVLSFFGWLGVSLFVFASGYGLSDKYREGIERKGRWIASHYVKLVILLLGGMVLFVLYPLLRDVGSVDFINWTLQSLLLLNIVDPGAIAPGVYWYVGMAFQLYLCFLLLRKLSNHALVVVMCMVALLLGVVPDNVVFYFRHNCVGWLLEFILGMLCARGVFEAVLRRSIKCVVALVSALLVLVCSIWGFTFCLSGIFFVGLVCMGAGWLSRRRVLLFLGAISAAIYVIHPVVRRSMTYAIDWLGMDFSPMARALAVLAISILLAMPYQWLYNKIRHRYP